MWILVGTGTNEGSQHWLAPGKTYSVGRKECNINISTDRSVSRKHATLTISKSSIGVVNDPTTTTTVTLTDENSKFGLYVNQDKISKRVLRDGDEIKFGAMNSTYKLVSRQLVLCCSGMRASVKKQLVIMATELDIKLVDRWSSECTHLVMQNIQVTQKVLFALLRCCYIVNDKWLEEIYRNRHDLETNFSLPEEKKFLPPVKEKIIDPNTISFLPNEKRRGLFKSKVFIVFSSSQLPKIAEPVEIGEGETVYYEGGLSNLDSFIARYHNPIFVRPPENTNGTLVDHLLSLGNDLVSEMDIGFAILHGNLDCFEKLSTKTLVNPSTKSTRESIEHQSTGARTTRSQSKLDTFLKPRTATTLSQSHTSSKPESLATKKVSARDLSSSILSSKSGNKSRELVNEKISPANVSDTVEDSLDSSIKKEPVVEIFSHGMVSPGQCLSQSSFPASPKVQTTSSTLKSATSKPISAREFTLSFFNTKSPVKRQYENEEFKPSESQDVARQRYTVEKQATKSPISPIEGDLQSSAVRSSDKNSMEVKSEVMEVNNMRNLAQVEFEDLIVKRKKRTKQTTYSGPNFKHFTKSYYPERDRNTLPTVVELVLHEHNIGTGADEQWLRAEVKSSESQEDSDIFSLHDNIGKVSRKRKATSRR